MDEKFKKYIICGCFLPILFEGSAVYFEKYYHTYEEKIKNNPDNIEYQEQIKYRIPVAIELSGTISMIVDL